MAFLDLVLLAAVAAFLGYRLWLVLGTHDADKPVRKRQSKEDDVVVPVRARKSPTAADTKTSQETEKPKSLDEDRFSKAQPSLFIRSWRPMRINGPALENLDGPLLETLKRLLQKEKRRNLSKLISLYRIRRSY
jgi:hypothetical protein